MFCINNYNLVTAIDILFVVWYTYQVIKENGNEVKDIDIFFRSEEDYAVSLYEGVD